MPLLWFHENQLNSDQSGGETGSGSPRILRDVLRMPFYLTGLRTQISKCESVIIWQPLLCILTSTPARLLAFCGRCQRPIIRGLARNAFSRPISQPAPAAAVAEPQLDFAADYVGR